MLFPKNISEKLGFNEIKESVRQECISPMGKEMVDKMQFITKHDLLLKLLQQTQEFRTIIDSPPQFPSDHFFDLRNVVDKLRVEGSFLDEEECFRLYLSLKTIFGCLNFFKEHGEFYPQLNLLADGVKPEKAMLTSIEKILDEKGKIRRNASVRLADIAGEIESAEKEARKKINLIYKHAQAEGWTGDTQLTIRDGRLVIPVLAEYKRKLKGFIHDESASGQTVFMEPAEVFELNNRIRDLEFERRREIIRILMELTDQLRPFREQLGVCHRFLSIIDFIRAKAYFAKKIDAAMPVLKNEPVVRLYDARHPLLFLSFRDAGKAVVPLSIALDEEQRIIVLSGPNAGGKSVCLKTLGLLQLMLQHGLLIPASNFSEVGVFKKIFADIGDDQSLESDLSTYSAHLSAMKEFVEQATSQSLVLIDEFGTGTDPKFGGPIAEAVLETLNRKKVRGLVTTHYSNLKVFANATPGIVNASMMFDTVNLQPLYKFEAGKPGSSYALEIAQKIGLPEGVLKLAKVKIGEEQKRIDTLLVDLERDQKMMLDRKMEADKKERRLQFLTEEAEKTKEFLEENKRKLLREAKQEVERIVKESNRLIENTIREITEAKADKEKTKSLRKKLDEELTKLNVKLSFPAETKSTEKIKPEKTVIKEGSWVRIKESETVGQVLFINKNKVELAIGDIRSTVKADRLEPTSKPAAAKGKNAAAQLYVSDYVSSKTQFSPQIDLRGKRGEEALHEIEQYLDKAMLMGFPTVRILHGKGDGILRKLIREYLRKYAEVESFDDEELEFGGSGITVVKLR